MKITDIKVQVIRRDMTGVEIAHGGVSIVGQLAEVPVLRILTDEGVEGTSFGRRGFLLAQYLCSLKPLLLGEDPMYVEQIWQKIWHMNRVLLLPQSVLGTVDVALWDIVGKVANLPVYKLLGAYRDKVRAYASSATYSSIEEYVKDALRCERIYCLQASWSLYS